MGGECLVRALSFAGAGAHEWAVSGRVFASSSCLWWATPAKIPLFILVYNIRDLLLDDTNIVMRSRPRRPPFTARIQPSLATSHRLSLGVLMQCWLHLVQTLYSSDLKARGKEVTPY